MEPHFIYCNGEMQKIWNQYGVFFSNKFCKFFSDSLELLFINKTGIKPSHKVTIAGFKQHNDIPMYIKGEISKLNLVLWNMPDFLHNLSFCWKSISGKIVSTDDEAFDAKDMECWLEGLQPALYWQQTATEKRSHPFTLKNLPFPVRVLGFDTYTSLTIQFRDATDTNQISKRIAAAIEKYNTESEGKQRANGVIHNFSSRLFEKKIEYRIDTGSAGILAINKIVAALKNVNGIEEMIIDC